MVRKQTNKEKRRMTKISLSLLLITVICVVIAIAWNIISISFRQSGAGETIIKEIFLINIRISTIQLEITQQKLPNLIFLS